MKKTITLLLLISVTSIYAKSLVIFNADKQIKSFTSLKKYKSVVKRIADKDTKAPGMTQSLLIETLKQDIDKGQYWYVFNGCSWDGKGGNTSTMKSLPIEIEFYISPAEALSLPNNGSPTKYLDKMSAMRFCFGSGSRNNSIKILLRRSFFQYVDKAGNELKAKTERCGKWIIISICRDNTGKPTSLRVKGLKDKQYKIVPASEYLFQVPKLPNWRYSNFMAVECWGKSPDNFGFNISRISIGEMPPAS